MPRNKSKIDCHALTHGQHGHEVGVDLLELDEPPVAVVVAVSGEAVPGRQIEPGVDRVDGPRGVVHVGEPVEAVGAEVGVDVFNIEAALGPPVL